MSAGGGNAPLHIGLCCRADLFPPVHGAAAKIAMVARHLSLLGHEVSLITNRRDVWFRYDHGELREYAWPRMLRRLPGPDLLARPLMRALEVPAVDNFLYSPLADPDYWARAAWAAAHFRFDVFQAEFPGYMGPVAAARRVRKCLTVLAEHNIEFQRIPQSSRVGERAVRHLRLMEMAALRAADLVICCSAVDRQSLADLGVRHVEVIPHGVEIAAYHHRDRARVRARYGLRDEDLVLVFHGVLDYGPNRDAVMEIDREIMPRLRQRGLRVRVIIAGKDPPPAVSPELVCTGVVMDLPAVIGCADIAVVPLRGGGGTRLKILEYFASGLPVISTAKGAEGIPAPPGEGWLAAETPDEFAAAVEDLIQHPMRRAEVGEAGARFAARYDWLEIARRHEAVYRARLR
ncbi:MAG: D-inositol-3-phosphate glycosyltransferase [Myxococcota bacterium]|nr:D-inositol-3-phosphate glycosyltransferase [Myxococcota bacterium]